jgi:hypothetical protein
MNGDAAVGADVLRRLYTTPPTEFVTARTALVKELRAAGERPSATAVAALRKPSTVDWALNVVASEHHDVVAAYLDAAAQVRDAQVAAAEGRAPSTDGRAALTALRAAVGKVVAIADEVVSNHSGGRGALVAPATARLSALVADVGASEQLRHGHLGSSPAEAVDPFAGLWPSDAPTPAQDPPTRRPRSTGRRRAPRTASTDEREAKARRQLADALAAAERDRDAARDELAGLDDRLADAQGAVSAAAAALHRLEEERAATAEERDAAAARLERQDAAVRAAEAALDDS